MNDAGLAEYCFEVCPKSAFDAEQKTFAQSGLRLGNKRLNSPHKGFLCDEYLRQ